MALIEGKIDEGEVERAGILPDTPALAPASMSRLPASGAFFPGVRTSADLLCALVTRSPLCKPPIYRRGSGTSVRKC